MLDYTGIKCPVCDDTLPAERRHRCLSGMRRPISGACYQKEGKCIFEEELHKAQGKPGNLLRRRWPGSQYEIKDRRISICATLNGLPTLCFVIAVLFSCGGTTTIQQHLSKLQSGTGTVPPPSTPYGIPPVPQGNMYGGPFPFPMDPMGGVSPTEILDENITFGDASS